MCRTQVIPSRGVKVAGILGPAAPVEKKGAAVADIPVGIGGTTQWKLAGLVRLPHCPCLLAPPAARSGGAARHVTAPACWLPGCTLCLATRTYYILPEVVPCPHSCNAYMTSAMHVMLKGLASFLWADCRAGPVFKARLHSMFHTRQSLSNTCMNAQPAPVVERGFGTPSCRSECIAIARPV